MKKKLTVLGLVLTLVLAFGGFQSVFANTIDGVKENQTDKIAYTYTSETLSGKYKVTDTEELKGWVDSGKKMVIVDTMPDKSYNTTNGHITGAVNAEVNLTNPGMTDAQKSNLLKVVNQALIDQGLTSKSYTYSSWKKTTKAAYKKITNKKLKKVKTVNGKKVYYKRSITKTTTIGKKSAPIVVYCGFVGCSRSHEAAAYLVKNGYTNVYRYGGGILAWIDAGYPVVKAETTPAA